MKFKLDPRHPGPLTAARRTRLQAVADKPDTAIDDSETLDDVSTIPDQTLVEPKTPLTPLWVVAK